MRWSTSLGQILAIAFCLFIGALSAPAAAQAAECTDTWIPASGEWQVAENWSAEHVPTSTDVACIPKEKTAQVLSGTHSVEVLQGEGRLTIAAGSLGLLGKEQSHIQKLHLSGGALKGPAELLVTESLNADGGSMEGAGNTVIGAEASGRVDALEEGEGPGLRLTEKRELNVKGVLEVAGLGGQLNAIEGAFLGVLNAGELAVKGPEGGIALSESADLVNAKDLTVSGPEGRLVLSDHATLLNSQTLSLEAASGGLFSQDEASIENTGDLTMEGSGGEIRAESTSIDNSGTLAIKAPEGRIRGSKGAILDNSGTLVIDGEGEGNGLLAGTGTPPKLTNTGTVLKDSGEKMALVEFKIDNEELVEVKEGALAFTGGGNSGQERLDSWSATGEETEVVFGGGEFTFGDEAAMAGLIQALESAKLKGHRFEAEEAQVWLTESSLELTGAKEESRFYEVATAESTVDLIKDGLLSAEVVFVESGGFDVEDDATVTAGELDQREGTTNFAEGAALVAEYVFLEGGTLDLRAHTESKVTEGFFQEGGEASIGHDAALIAADTFIGQGPLGVGDDSDVTLEDLFIEEGSASFGVGTSLNARDTFVEEGPLEFAADAEVGLRDLYVEDAAASVGEGGSLSARETYVEQAPLEIGSGTGFESEALYLEESDFSVAEGATATLHEAWLGGGTLDGAGTVVAAELFWENSTMEGTGETVVTDIGGIANATACGFECEPIPSYAQLQERKLVTEGFFTLGLSTLAMSDGALLRNTGKFDASSEDTEHGAQLRVAEESTTNPKIVNKHEFNKETGGGTTVVTVPFENDGTIAQFSGTLHIVNRLGVPASEKFGFRCNCGDPVEAASGDFSETQTDFAIGGLGVGLVLSRTYSAQAAATAASPGAFGYGWTNSFADRLAFEEEGKRITVQRADGSTVPFTADGKGGFEPPPWSQDKLSGNSEAGYTYTSADQIKRHFAPSGALQSVTDRNGNETTLFYSEAGRLKTITDPAGREINLTYNGEGLVESAEDPMGHTVKYGYEGKELAGVAMPGEAEPRWQFEYDPSHRMTKIIDGRGGETTNEYDGSDRVISQADPAERTLAFAYDGFHSRITNEATGAVTDLWFNSDNEPFSITHGFGTEYATTETFSYDEAGHQLSRTDGNGHTTSYTYNPAGDRTSKADADENETKWEYNATHDVISETTPNGETTTIGRDSNGNPETISRPAPGEATQTTAFEYTAKGELKALTDPLERTWTYEYDSQGNRESEADPKGDKRTWAYDEDSRLISTVSPRGNEKGAEPSEFETTIERDPRGRPEEVIDPLGHKTEYVYDPNGNLESETDAKGHTTKFTYNPDDELIKTERPSGAVLKTEYDGAGVVTAQIDGNEQAMTYVRNVLEQPIETIDPLERKTVREFDSAGNLEAVIDPLKRVTTYTYDPANRLEGISYSEEATPDVSFEYDPDGNMITMSDGTGESTFAYDQLDRLEEATNGHGDTVAYEYNLADEQERIVYPNGENVDRAFDGAGRLESITDWLGHTTEFEYDADSNVEAIAFPTASGNVDEFTYDPTDRMLSANMKKASESLAAIAYARDELGQVEAMASEGLPGAAEQGYEYDEDNRLIKAGSGSYEYDPADNPLKTPTSINAFDDADQLETGTGVGYEYDPLGERVKATPTEGPTTTYSYNQAGNLTAAKRAKEGEVLGIDEAFAYDGAGLMSSRTVGETTSHLTWDASGGLPLLLDDGQAGYIYGPGGLPIEQIDAEEAPTYYHHDQLGSTRMLTNASGEATAKFTYDAYGGLEASSGAQTTPLGYAGQYTLVQSGLQYLRARIYDPQTGQFLTRDPLEEVTREPYAYAYDNPLNGTDPNGRVAGAVAGCAVGEVVEPAGGCAPGAVAGAAASVAAAGAAALAGAAAGALTGDEEIAGTLTISKGLAARLAKENEAQEAGEEAVCKPSDSPNFEDPSQPPGPGWEWRPVGDTPGTGEGAWYNPDTGESLRPALDDEIHGPHYDYKKRGEQGDGARVYPDGRIEPKQ
jgi:RHS repeat-associated protein